MLGGFFYLFWIGRSGVLYGLFSRLFHVSVGFFLLSLLILRRSIGATGIFIDRVAVENYMAAFAAILEFLFAFFAECGCVSGE